MGGEKVIWHPDGIQSAGNHLIKHSNRVAGILADYNIKKSQLNKSKLPPNAKKYIVNSNHGATNAMINLYVPHATSNEMLHPKPPLA